MSVLPWLKMEIYDLSLQGSPLVKAEAHSFNWFGSTSPSNEAMWTLGKKKRGAQRPWSQKQLCRVGGTMGRTQPPGVSWAATKWLRKSLPYQPVLCFDDSIKQAALLTDKAWENAENIKKNKKNLQQSALWLDKSSTHQRLYGFIPSA